ncbi:hypothetical protein [Desulfuromonas acetoxidans]|nr:hypothetical protein [Desulfuromonas acetoxidans]
MKAVLAARSLSDGGEPLVGSGTIFCGDVNGAMGASLSPEL